MIRPVDGPVGQGFGENPTSVLPANHWVIKQFGNYQPDGHSGEDYPVPIGTPIRAVTSGRVLHVGFYGGAYRDNPYWIAPNFAGYCYVIDHGAFIGIYAHGKDKGARVSVGQSVSEGQVIGLSGNTGGSTGPHLHFEILPDKFIVNSRMYGRINPASLFGSAAIAPQGTTKPATPKGFLMALSDAKQELLFTRIERYLDAPVSAVPEKTWAQTVTRGGKQISVKQELADAKSEAQALRGAVLALSTNPGLTKEELTAAMKLALADGVTVDVNVNGGK